MALHQTHRAAKCMAMWRKKKKNNFKVSKIIIILMIKELSSMFPEWEEKENKTGHQKGTKN